MGMVRRQQLISIEVENIIIGNFCSAPLINAIQVTLSWHIEIKNNL
jgi:hypothetical protein